MNTKKTYFLLNLILIFILSGCLGTKHLKEGELLLVEQKIKGAKKVPASQLDDYYRQEPNRTFGFIPWTPYVSLHYLGLKFYDKEKIREKKNDIEEKYDAKIAEAQKDDNERRVERLQNKKRDKIEKKNKILDEGNILMRVGEPIAVYDSSLTKETAEQMESYLHTKGYFHGKVGYDRKIEERKVYVTYQIEESKPFYIDTAFLTVGNNKIGKLLTENSKEGFIDTGKVYDQEMLTLERQRIEKVLRNNGFYDFSQQYIEFNVDTTLGGRNVAVETVIYRPAGRGYHKQFRVDSVVLVTSATSDIPEKERKTKIFNNLVYKFHDDVYSRRVLDNRIFIRPDSLYSKDKTLETQKQLTNLDIFKFININYDSSGNQFIARILTSPLKKYQTNNEVGLTVSQGIPGPYFNSIWTARNFFGGLEIFQLDIRAGIEGVPATTSPEATKGYSSTFAGADLSVYFPQFILPLSDKSRYRTGRYNPKTRFLLGFNYADRPEFKRSTYNTSVSYSWQKERRTLRDVHNTLFTVVPFDISIIRSDFKTTEEGIKFEQQLEEWFSLGNPYKFSFSNSFVSSIYGFIIFNKNNYGTYTEESRYDRVYLESGGTTQNFIDPTFIENRGLRTFQFLKFSNDFRKFNPLSSTTGLAYRLNFGIAVPYGGEEATLPYEKFFFAGGSNSIRAFKPRRLGPGSYTPPPRLMEDPGNLVTTEGDPKTIGQPSFTNLIEQPGEILLEGSIEHRHNIFSFLNGAVFLDFGNVWRLEKSKAFPQGEFRFNRFYKEIALGPGYGFRLDFSFLVVRFDFAYQLYNPMRAKVLTDSEGNIIRDTKGDALFEESTSSRWGFNHPFTMDQINFNIGIGYPF